MDRLAADITRRRALAWAGAAGALTMPTPTRASILETLALFGPPAAPSITLAHAVAIGAFEEIAPAATFTVWRNPDELRAGLTSGRMALTVAPVQAATNLYNRGFPLRLVNTMTDGLLYVLATEPAIDGMAALRGRSIAVAFRGDTPDITLRALLRDAGLDPDRDVQLRSAGTMIEGAQLLLSGRVEAALVSEPAASATILRGQQAGVEIARAIDVQLAWGSMVEADPRLPQAGLVATDGFLDAHAELIEPLTAALAAAVDDVHADRHRAAHHATEALGMPAPVLAAAIPHARLIARPARVARPEIERMLNAMGEEDMERIGGRMPDDGFYL